jgi:hypothetical protein
MNILLEFAAKALNMTQDEVQEIVDQDGGLEQLTQAYAAHVKTVKDSGYKAAERKVNKTWEDKLKADFDLQSDTVGTALLDEVQDALTQRQPKPETKELTEAQLKKLPYVMQLEKRAQEAETSAEEKWKKVLAEKEEAWQQKELFGTVKESALGIIDTLKPVLSQDPAKAQAQKNVILRELEQNYRFLRNGDEIVLLDKETGERLDNESGHAVRFEDVVKKHTTSYYDLQASDPRSSSGRKPDEQAPTVAMPKNKAEYIKLLSDESIPAEEKMKAIEAYQSADV